MSHLPVEEFSYKDASLDAFGRLPVAPPITIFDSKTEYGKEPLIWDESTPVGGATSTFLPNESSVELAVTAANGDKIIRATHRSVPYTPGKAHTILLTGHMAASQVGTRSRYGLFNAEDGFFLERTSAGMFAVYRTSVSGAAADTTIAQSAWNMDKLDGTGPSGLNIDFGKTFILHIDAQWLGVGRVRMGVVANGRLVFFHEFLNDNVRTTVYTKTFTLSMRAEIENTAAAPGVTSMKIICATAQSGGDFSTVRVHNHSISNGTTSRNVTTALPLLAIRPAATCAGKANRIQIKARLFGIFTTDRDVFLEIYWRTSVTGGAGWVAVPGGESCVEYNATGTGITGGQIINSDYVPISGGGGSKVGTLTAGARENIFLFVGDLASGPDELALVATRLGTGTAVVYGSLAWEELR